MKNLKSVISNFAKGILIGSAFIGVFSLFTNSTKAQSGGIDLNLDSLQLSRDNDNWVSSLSDLNLNQKVYFFTQFENKGPVTADNVILKLDLPDNTNNVTAKFSIESNSPRNGDSAKGAGEVTAVIKLKESNFRLFYNSDSAKAKGDFDGDGAITEIALGGDLLNGGKNIGSVVSGKNISVTFEGYVIVSGDPKLDTAFAIKSQNSDKVSFMLQLHNTVVGTEAKDVKFKLSTFPESFGKSAKITATGSSQNAGSSSKDVTVTFDKDSSRITYIPDSLKISWDQDGNGANDYNEKSLNDSNLFSSGVSLPDNKILFGCYDYIVYIYFDAKVEYQGTPEIWVDKFVSSKDSDYKDNLENKSFKAGEKIYFLVEFGNKGTADATGVVIKDELPSYVKFDSGEGDYDKNGNTVEYKVDTLKAGQKDEFRFTAKVKDDMVGGCYDNKAKIYANGQDQDKDEATFCLEKEGKVLGVTTLPETGGSPIGLVVAGIMSLLGFGLMRAR